MFSLVERGGRVYSQHMPVVTPGDSIHVASALEMGCEEILSSDEKLGRLLKNKGALLKLGLQVRSGRQTRCLPLKYRQLELDDGKNGKNGKNGKTH